MSGIKISLPGYDVNTATPEQLALSSDYISPKLLLQQTPAHAGTLSYVVPATVTPGTTTNLISVNHGYSYTPACLVQWSGIIDNGPGITSFGIAPMNLITAPPISIYAYCTATQFRIDLVVDATHPGNIPAPIGGQTALFRYYILAESGA